MLVLLDPDLLAVALVAGEYYPDVVLRFGVLTRASCYFNSVSCKTDVCRQRVLTCVLELNVLLKRNKDLSLATGLINIEL